MFFNWFQSVICVINDFKKIANNVIVANKISSDKTHIIAAKNGAEALGFENLGTFEKGKIPGVNLIQNLDEMKLIETSFLEII